MTDDDFVSAFLACRLSPDDFGHGAHLRIAWLLVRRHPLPHAIETICDGLERIAQHFGVPAKYNRTVSEALVRLVAHAIAGGPADATFEEFVRANVPLVNDVRGVLAQYYSAGLLHSADARQRFVMPDRRTLP